MYLFKVNFCLIVWSIYIFILGILEICWVEDIGIIIFFRFFEKKGRVILWEKKIFIVYIYIYKFFCF